MIEVIVLIVIGLWLSVSAMLDGKKFRRQPGRLLRFLSLLLMAVLMAESHFLYKAEAVKLLPDCLAFSLMLLLSEPLSGDPAGHDWLRILSAAAVAGLAVSIPSLSGRGCTLSHLITLCAIGIYLLGVSFVTLNRWIRNPESQRSVTPVRMAELRVRHSDIVFLLLMTGGTSLAMMIEGHSALLWVPCIVGTAFYGVLYYRAGTFPALSSGWLGRVATACPDPPKSLSREPLDDEFYKAVYRKCCHYMESKKPFLVESFSLGDLATGVFTNKSYVSKAINRSSSLNFRRFVNRYRVAYAQEIFKQNMALRVQDLTMLSGCHSIQTFCAVFKLFTGETPRDWCARMRKERQ